MRNLTLLLISIMWASIPMAQVNNSPRCVLPDQKIVSPNNIKTELADFTITDTEGNVLNLYETLAEGKTVFLDLFFTTCGYCISYTPIIEEIYQNYGAGEGDVVFWAISPSDGNAAIETYKETHNVTNPCAGTDGGGPAAIDLITAGQNFLGYPTYCVVCPDKTLHFDPCYPPTVTGFDSYFESCGAGSFTAQFTANETEICETASVEFNATTSGATSWQWVFEGGTPATSTAQNPTVSYSSSGNYDVTLTVSNGSDESTKEFPEYITVNSTPETPETCSGPEQVIIDDEPTSTYTASPVASATSYHWTIQPQYAGSIEGTALTAIVTWNDAFMGEAIIQLSAINSCGESNMSEGFTTQTIVQPGIENIEKNLFSCFPNPVSNQLTLEFNQTELPYIVTIMNINGALIYSTQIKAGINSVKINTSSIPAGIYFIKAESSKQVSMKKLQIVK